MSKSPHEIEKRAVEAKNAANLSQIFEALSELNTNGSTTLMPKFNNDSDLKKAGLQFNVKRSNQLQDHFNYSEQQADKIAAKEWERLTKPKAPRAATTATAQQAGAW